MVEVLETERQLSIDKSNWTLVKLGELAEDISKRVDNPAQSGYERFVGLEHFVSGDLIIKSWGTTKNLTSAAKAFQKGDILFARRNAYLRRASLVDFDGICSGDAFVIRENHSRVVPGFLAFIMNSNALWDYANSNAAGTMSKRVKWRDLAEYEFLLPPIDQQEQIAELLWAGNCDKSKAEFLLQKCQGIRNSLFEIRLQESDKDSGVKWEHKKLSDFAKIVRGSSPRPAGSPKYFNGSFLPWVTVGMLTYNPSPYLERDCIQTYLTEEGSKKTRIIPAGTVILSNSGFSLGVPSILKFEAGANDGIAAFLDLKGLIPEYLYYFLDSKTTFLRTNIAAGADQPNLNTTRIGNLLIPNPPESVQKKIVEEMLQIDSTLYSINKKINSSNTLLKNILNQIL